MGRDKAGRTHTVCASCGTGPTCLVCGGSGGWTTRDDTGCTHCTRSGRCPMS